MSNISLKPLGLPLSIVDWVGFFCCVSFFPAHGPSIHSRLILESCFDLSQAAFLSYIPQEFLGDGYALLPEVLVLIR
ncbi:hypothetical protein IC582_005243 [Cucumis melo]